MKTFVCVCVCVRESWERNAIIINKREKIQSKVCACINYTLVLKKQNFLSGEQTSTCFQCLFTREISVGRTLVVYDVSVRLRNANFYVCWKSNAINTNNRERKMLS